MSLEFRKGDPDVLGIRPGGDGDESVPGEGGCPLLGGGPLGVFPEHDSVGGEDTLNGLLTCVGLPRLLPFGGEVEIVNKPCQDFLPGPGLLVHSRLRRGRINVDAVARDPGVDGGNLHLPPNVVPVVVGRGQHPHEVFVQRPDGHDVPLGVLPELRVVSRDETEVQVPDKRLGRVVLLRQLLEVAHLAGEVELEGEVVQRVVPHRVVGRSRVEVSMPVPARV